MTSLDARDPRSSGPNGRAGRSTLDDSDRGLAALRDATLSYSRLREDLLEERAANADLQQRLLAQIALTEKEQRRADAERRRLEAEQRRATALLASIQEMHRALFRGTTAEYVLRASLNVTDAERGYYVADEHGGLRVRAAVDVPAASGEEPSPFISGIVRQVLETGETLHWTADAPPDGMTPGHTEHFREGVAVPVTMRGAPCGVIIALDRDGEFREEEVEKLITVGTEAGVALENARLRLDLQRAYTATISMLADTVSAKDPYTQGHCEQVSQYARIAAERLELSTEEKRVTCYAALLHDVGKIGVSDGVLNKPGPLMAEERKLVEAHVRIGHDLLVGIPALRDVASAVLYHHEWWDGNGYPEGRRGEDIPVASRIVAVVDAYCAMLDRRSYKEASTPEQACAELKRCAGTQFDPRIVEVVLSAIDDANAAEAAGTNGPDAQTGCGILPGMVSARA